MILRARKNVQLVGLFFILIVLPACNPPNIDPAWAAEELYNFGLDRMEQEDWLDALDAFKAITLSHSGSDIVDDALYHQGEMHIKLKEYPLAVMVFRRLISDFPQSSYSDQSQYKLAYATFLQSNPPHLTQDKTFEAIRELQFFQEEYPNSEWSTEVHELLQECFDKVAEKDYRIGNLYYKMKDWEAARVYFRELLEAYPMSNWASQAQFEIADSYVNEGDFQEAIKQFEIFVQSYSGNPLSAEAIKRLELLKSKHNPPDFPDENGTRSGNSQLEPSSAEDTLPVRTVGPASVYDTLPTESESGSTP